MKRTYLLPIKADWPVVDTDCLVVGSGIAGLFTAIKVGVYGHTTVLTKKSVRDCNTGLAQGGIAAAVHEADSPFLHLEDTLDAGDGLCEVNAVQVLVE
ncbi:MAG: FAD-binding protein, partial [Methylocystaceae bacterium]